MKALFPSPDFTQCFLMVRRQFLSDFMECEAKVWDFILDKTLAGYDKAADVLSVSQVMEGAGLSLNASLKGLRGLEERGIIYSEVLFGKERLVLLSVPSNVELLQHYKAKALTAAEFKELAIKPLTPPKFEAPQNLGGSNQASTPPEYEAPQILGGSIENQADRQNPDNDLLLHQLGADSAPPQILTPPKFEDTLDLDLVPDLDLDLEDLEKLKISGEAARAHEAGLASGHVTTPEPCLIPKTTDVWYDLPRSARPPWGFTQEQWHQYCDNRSLPKDPVAELAARQKKDRNRLKKSETEQLAVLQSKPLPDLVHALYARCIPNPKNPEQDAKYLNWFIDDLAKLVPDHPRLLLLLDTAFEKARTSNHPARSIYPVKSNLYRLCAAHNIPAPEIWAGKKGAAA